MANCYARPLSLVVRRRRRGLKPALLSSQLSFEVWLCLLTFYLRSFPLPLYPCLQATGCNAAGAPSCSVCNTCSASGSCVAVSDGLSCTDTGGKAGVCTAGACALTGCNAVGASACAACQACSLAGVCEAVSDGVACTGAGGKAGVCTTGACDLTGCNAVGATACPDCQFCSVSGSCAADQSQQNGQCSVGANPGACDGAGNCQVRRNRGG